MTIIMIIMMIMMIMMMMKMMMTMMMTMMMIMIMMMVVMMIHVQRYLLMMMIMMMIMMCRFFSISSKESGIVHKSGKVVRQRLHCFTSVGCHLIQIRKPWLSPPVAKCRSCCPDVSQQCCPRASKNSVLRSVSCRR